MKISYSKWTLLVLFTLSFFTTQSPAQMRSQSIELSCIHLYPIQMKYLEKHINYAEESKNLESRTVDQFVKKLDGSKLYLLEKDVAEMEKLIGPIFSKLQKKDCSGIEKAQALFTKKVKERVEYAKKYLGPKFKFNDKTEILLDPDHRKRPKTLAEANAFHEKYMQYQVASYIATDMKVDEAKQQVLRNYERILRRIDATSKTDLWSYYLDAFARALDPHSSYLSADALEDFEIQMRLSLEGIGATLSSQDGFTVIEQLIPGGAAFNSGKLKAKDKIIAVAQGDSDEFTNVIEMDLRDVVRLIRGQKGSKVKLKILRKGKETERFEVVLLRDKIKLDDDAASITYIDKEVNGQKKKIGLLTLPSFYADNRKDGPSAASDMKKLLADAQKNNADAIVLDLSSNGGGSLSDAVKISGLFFARGNVVKQSQRGESEEKIQYEVLRDSDEKVDWAGPLVVLTSRVSASASEIVSGALQDYKRAVIVGGDHTFGKGSVQSVEYLPPGLGAIKTTVGMFFIPGGNSTQHRGVNGDIVFPSVLATDDIGEKTLDYSLPPKKIKEFVSKEAYVTDSLGAWKQVTPELIANLKKKSDARVTTSEGFKKISADFKKAQKRQKAMMISELLKDKNDKKKSAKGDAAVAAKGDDAEAEDSDVGLSREERKKKYMERADVQEAMMIAADLAAEYAPTLTLGATKDATKPNKAAEPSTTPADSESEKTN